jgi:hypothetical protein
MVRRSHNIMDALRECPPVPPEEPKLETLESALEEIVSDEVLRYAPKHARDSGEDMKRVQGVLSDGVTAAHHEACERVDRAVDQARALLDRLVIAAEAHKARLRQEGQDIAVKLQAAIQELTKTVEWAEQRGLALRSPELALPKPELPLIESGGES